MPPWTAPPNRPGHQGFAEQALAVGVARDPSPAGAVDHPDRRRRRVEAEHRGERLAEPAVDAGEAAVAVPQEHAADRAVVHG